MTEINAIRYSVPAMRYADAICEMGISREQLENLENIFRDNPDFFNAMSNPVISIQDKHNVLDKIIDDDFCKRFLKVLCDNRSFRLLFEITGYARELLMNKERKLIAYLRYVTAPSEKQLENMEKLICEKHNCSGVEWEMTEDPSLIGGFILTVDGITYDRSIDGRLKNMTRNLTGRR